MTPHDATRSSECGDDAALEALLTGTLPAPLERDLETHLGSCSACRARLDSLAATPERWSEVRSELSGGAVAEPDPDSGPPIPALLTLIRKLLAPSDDERMLGRLGPYEIAGIVGSGGMGIVLKGHDRALDRFVAIKLLAPHLATSGAARQRFLREAKAAAAVVHDNVIAIHGVDEFAGLPYLVMPYCRGTTLEKRLRDAGPMRLREILRVGLQTARGLAAAHAQGLVHRDVKPANILLDDGVERVLLTDFGLARAADDATLTVTGLLAGTPHYMSPEQALGKPVDARSDLFALGAVLFTMATGKPPFRAESSHAVLRQVTDVEPADIRVANPDLPGWFAGLTHRLLAKDPAERVQSAAEVAAILEGCLAHVNDPLAKPLPAAAAACLAPLPGRTGGRASFTLTPSTFLARLRDLMSDQRILAIVALVLFLMAILLPWPIAALGRDEPALVFAAVAALASLLFASLGRRDSLGRLVLKLAGAAAALGAAVVALWVLSAGRRNAEHVAALRAENLAKQAHMEAIAQQPNATGPMTIHVTPGQQPSTPVPMAIPLPAGPRVASGPDPMPIVTWPAGKQPANLPRAMNATPSAPAVVPPVATSPMGSMTGDRNDDDRIKAERDRLVTAEIAAREARREVERARDLMTSHLDAMEKALAEHPYEAIALCKIQEQGDVSPDSGHIAIGPEEPMRSREDHLLGPATTLQKEFTTAFLGRPVTRLLWNIKRVSPASGSTYVVETPIEDGDGFQQQFILEVDPNTGAILKKERMIRFTLDGRFRTLDRTVAGDFREVAPGLWLPHAIDIDAFDIEADKPENTIPRKLVSFQAVVQEWRPKEPAASPPAEADVAPVDATSADPAPESPSPRAAGDDSLVPY